MSASRAGARKPADRHSPYQGLVPYAEEDADWFFGRTTWSEIIVDHLRAYRLSVLYGASGVGKSSVLSAGVARTLHAETHDDGRLALLPVAFSSWSLDDPVGALARAIREALEGLAPELAEHPPEGRLAELLDGWAARIDGPLLLVLDQFEELFLYAETDDSVRGKWHEAAAEEVQRALSRRNPAVHFMLSIREDALASLDRFQRRVPGLLDRLLRLEHLDRAAAEEAIRKPLERWNALVAPAEMVELEQGLVTEILDQVQQSTGDGDRGGAAARTEEIEAPYLQLVLTRLWDEERRLWEQQNGRPRQLRVETLNVRLGRVESIVDTHLDTALRDLQPEQQAVAAAVFRQLVTPSHTKIALGVGDLHAQTQVPEQAIEDVIRRLAGPDVRILRPAGEGRYEIFHDALSRPILAWLRRWTDRQRQRRERRRLALALGAAAALAALAGVFVLLLLRAVAAEDRSERNEAQALASSALAELQVDPAPALRSALEAVKIRRTEDTDAAMRAVIAQLLLDRVFPVPSRVFAGAYTADGKLLAIGGGDIRVWDTASGRRVARFDGGSLVMDLAFDPRGRRVAASLNNGKVQVWDVATGRRRVMQRAWDGLAGDVRFSPDGRLLAAAGQDGTARIWSAASGARLAVLRHPDQFVNTVAFSPDSTVVATSSWDGGARIWRVTDGEPVATLMHGGPVNDAVFSRDGRLVLTASDDGTARLWDFRRGTSLVLRAHLEGVNGAAFSPDGTFVATAGADGARLWRATSGRKVAFDPGAAGSVEFDRAGGRLLTTSEDTARLWSAGSGDLLAVLANNGPIYAAGLRPDGLQVFTAAVEGATSTVRVWRTSGTEQPTGALATGDGGIGLAPNGHLIAVTGPGRAVHIRRTADLREVVVFTLPAKPTVTRFSADGRLLLAGDAEGTVSLWSTKDWKPGPTLRTGAEVEGATFSRDSRLIATVSGGTAQVWNASTGAALPGASVAPQGTEACAPPWDPEFSPDGSFIVFEGCASQRWDYRRPGSTKLLRVNGDTANEVEFSSDGTLLLGQGEETAVLWRLDGTRLRETARRRAEDSALSSDGTLAATVRSGTIEVWRTGSGRTITVLPTRDDFPRATFSLSGRLLITTGSDYSHPAVRLWDTQTGTLLASLAGVPASEGGLSVALSDDESRVVVLAYPLSGGNRAVLYRCVSCGEFEDVLELARRQAVRLGQQ